MSVDPTADDLDKPPSRQLLDEAYGRLLESDVVDELMPGDGTSVVIMPTSVPDDELASAVLRVRLASDSSESRNAATERTILLQVQIDWTSNWNGDSSPTWEVDVREALEDELARLGGPSLKPLGSGGDVNADWSDQLERYVGDATYRYRIADVPADD